MARGNLRVLVVDDELPARSRLATMVADVGGWDVVAEAGNGHDALQAVGEHEPDVVLLDIRMPGMDGVEVASHLTALPTPPAVVFTTAYDEYAVQAFETNAVGYLLKPVRRERLLQALERAARVHRWQLNDLINTAPELCARQHISVTSGTGVKLIPVSDVQSFHADQKYVRMVHAGGEALIDESLKTLEQEFEDEFVRLHRNSLVRITAIEELERDDNGQYRVRLSGASDWLPVSRRHASTVKHCLAAVSG
ncbi:MAG: response regulator [Gammaproteobacteria bacterium]|nr:response regulator [Gammaproteobacteria bacterium]NND53893.1 response regulator [Gammaproteobacteria bacterium]